MQEFQSGASGWGHFEQRSYSPGTVLCDDCWPQQTHREREREWPTNAQLFLIGNSAPMADLHSGACTSLNPWPCQTQPWGKVGGNQGEKQEGGEAGVKRGEKKQQGGKKRKGKRKREPVFVLLYYNGLCRYMFNTGCMACMHV